MEKRKVLGINIEVLIIIIAMILGVIAIFGYDYYNDIKINSCHKCPKERLAKTDNKVVEKNLVSRDSLVGAYIYQTYTLYGEESGDHEFNKFQIELQLNNDGTYFYTECEMACGASSGTWILENDKLILEEKKSYGSDACYYISNKDLEFEYLLNGSGEIEGIMEKEFSNILIKTTIDKLTNNKNYINNESTNCGPLQ